MRHRNAAALSLAALLAVALLIACTSGDAPAPPTATFAPETPTPAPAATPTPEPRPTPVRPQARPFPDNLRQSSEALLDQIAAVRGTPLKEPVEMFLLTREQARDFYSSTGGVTGGGPQIDVRQTVYELLGLIPERPDVPPGQNQPPTLEQSQVDNLISLITGFYSPEHNALYLVDSAINSRSTIVHELTHALQYQYADILSIEAQRRDDWDATTALLHVLEGDAVNTEIDVLGFSTRQSYRSPVCFTIPAPQRTGTPYVVERELDTWYEDGLCFVQAVRQHLSLEELFANLPATTEQILHPEKYLAGEGRIAVRLPGLDRALAPGWVRAGGGTFGEFMVQNILLAGIPNQRPLVQQAAAGWGGDAWQLYVNGASRLLHFQIVWDTPEDASEFWAALLASLNARGATAPAADAQSFLTALGPTLWRGDLNGASTLFALSNDEVALQQVPPASRP